MELPDRIAELDILTDPALDEIRMRIRVAVLVAVLVLGFMVTIAIDVLSNVEGVVGWTLEPDWKE